jgi:hypothetical protein
VSAIQEVLLQTKLQSELAYNLLPLKIGLATKSQSVSGVTVDNVPLLHHKDELVPADKYAHQYIFDIRLFP